MPPDFSTLHEGPRVRQVRRLSWGLVLSVSLNFVFLVMLLWDRSGDSRDQLQQPAEQSGYPEVVANRTNSDYLQQLQQMSVAQLLAQLQDDSLVEDGFSRRDLALAVLVADRYFDLGRALLNSEPIRQKRTLQVNRHDRGADEVTVYPAVKSAQWQAIEAFAQTERWPFTSEGLFHRLKEQGMHDESLVSAFCMTDEFSALEELFVAGDRPVQREQLLKMLLQGSWDLMAHHSLLQRTSRDAMSIRRSQLLSVYVQASSDEASRLLVELEPEYALRKLSDAQVIEILRVLDSDSKAAQSYAAQLLTSPRSDDVWYSAAQLLYRAHGESVPEPYHHRDTLARFAPGSELDEKWESSEPEPVPAPKAVEVVQKQPEASQGEPYTVQRGDSLWKIARRHKVSIESIKKHNRLTSDVLQPGTTLYIPR